jgi:hypothetical protein
MNLWMLILLIYIYRFVTFFLSGMSLWNEYYKYSRCILDQDYADVLSHYYIGNYCKDTKIKCYKYSFKALAFTSSKRVIKVLC